MFELLSDWLFCSHSTTVEAATLAGKVVGIYFSAHCLTRCHDTISRKTHLLIVGCGPCRGFTPSLVKWFENFKATNEHKNELELVFVSSDQDEAAFKDYHAEMNFHAMPYADRDTKVCIFA